MNTPMDRKIIIHTATPGLAQGPQNGLHAGIGQQTENQRHIRPPVGDAPGGQLPFVILRLGLALFFSHRSHNGYDHGCRADSHQNSCHIWIHNDRSFLNSLVSYHIADSLSSIYYKKYGVNSILTGDAFVIDRRHGFGYNEDIPQRRFLDMKKKQWLLIPLCLVLLAAAYFLLRSRIPQRWYTADELGISQQQSALDADGDGVDDWTDMVLGARSYIATNPHYESKYYAGGYPDDGLGVCTDVIWQAFRAAGYSLKDLVDADIAAHPECYPNVETPDGNIDFRRVSNLDTFFRRHAQVLTCDLDDPAQWQPGDIVIFGDRDHIAICSDRRNRRGIPFIIHHGNPIDEAVERNDIYRQPVTGHFRWMG